MTPPRRAFGASPSRGRYQRPGKAGSTVSLVLECASFMRHDVCVEAVDEQG